MKKVIIASFAVLLFLSCTKSKEAVPSTTSAIVESFERMTEEEQRIAFNTLTVDEKVALATEHIDFCLGYYDFNKEQINSLNATKDKLHAIYSAEDVQTCIEFASVELDIAQYFENRSFQEISIIFNSMVTDESEIEGIFTNPNAPKVECNCSSQSNYCNGFTSGRVPCDITYCNVIKESGCGTFWTYSCNGKCHPVPIRVN